MSRAEAKRRFTLDDHAKATAGVECRKDEDVIDERPRAYKSIDAVMECAARSGGRSAHAAPGGVRKGLNKRGLKGPV
jgi:RNA-splicing ligase RtcB